MSNPARRARDLRAQTRKRWYADLRVPSEQVQHYPAQDSSSTPQPRVAYTPAVTPAYTVGAPARATSTRAPLAAKPKSILSEDTDNE